jgi:trehalose 6-phosphate synthase/phosphatase
VGWAGGFEGEAGEERISGAARSAGAVPVALPRDLHGRFYGGFSNRTLWPLCHTFPSFVHLEEGEWDAYRAVNLAFRDAVLRALRPGDAVWVHDFHLMLLPALLRERSPDLPVAYFHHVPFPSFDVLRVLPDPWARALVAGVLRADVAGFQTYDDVRAFLRAAERLLGVESEGGTVTERGRVSLVDAFPIGVDFARWDAAGDDEEVAAEARRLRPSLAARRVVISVDRLDYTKGILNRLLAFERLLEHRPGWRRHVSLVVVAVPSRVEVEAYRRMRTQIEEAVGRVNGRYGDLSWTPIVYQYRALDFPALAALYQRADVALVTPLRDGMNLVAKEFLAARRDEDGVLVLSDTVGAARELGEAILVNPFHVDGLADALDRALRMPRRERRRRSRHMRTRLARFDVVRWGSEQLTRLADANARTRALRARSLPEAECRCLAAAWRSAARRLLLLDYDGTLVAFTNDPDEAVPDRGLLDVLARLAADERAEVVVVSGRDAGTLERWFEGIPLALVAEHGACMRTAGGAWSDGSGLDPAAKRRVQEIMDVFADRLPGAFVEPKEYSIAWHWRAADPVVGEARARELAEALAALRLGREIQTVVGKRVVEVRGAEAHKGAAARRWLREGKWGIVVAAGDDTTDEDLFAALPDTAWTLRVGPGQSRARFNVDGPDALRRVLEDLGAPEAGA